ncbi:hypothetical protein BCT21_07210 [Vibrio sp. 10N.222.55.F9]|uniref:hypothetical protein n=1 Tax=Vibrio sp. 10N.222.55.F9 TaxID=1884471 RepID=UPI000C83EE43|nr:hypothetical protein [Vibrio sp. 10N.222.55.F9]PMO02813.1 hypothetical protein BCT21_07210 [Vibrio sp. 10N.222.55.F9]
MGLFKGLLQCEGAPVAKTQIIDVQGALKENVCRLLCHDDHSMSVVYGFRDGKKKRLDGGKKESAEEYAKRMHCEIKEIIRNKLGLNKRDSVTYETARVYTEGSAGERWFFFYLAESVVDTTALVQSLERDGLLVQRVFESIMSLHLKRFFVADAETSYPIKPVCFNSELFVNANKAEGGKKEGYYINALRPELYCGPKQDLCLTIKRITFKAEQTDGFFAQTEDTTLYFQSYTEGEKAYKVLKRVDARKRQIPYMSFGSEYKFCVNYTEHLMMEVLRAVLDAYAVPYTQRYFQANYVSDKFLEVTRERELPLVIIDDLGDRESDEQGGRAETICQLQKTLNPAVIMKSSELSTYDKLHPDHAYLVLNRSTSDGSSIRNYSEEQRHALKVEEAYANADRTGDKPKLPKKKVYRTFWQALEDHKKKPDDSFDYYTSLKLTAFNQGNMLVLQGMNFDLLVKDRSQGKKNKDTGEVINKVIPAVDVSKLAKVEMELWLKERVRIHKNLLDIDLPDGDFLLYKIRKTKGNGFMAFVVSVKIQDSTLSIGNVERYIDEDKLRTMHECLDEDVIPTLYDGGFYLFDVENEMVLSDYHTKRVPRIIGNSDVDSIAVGLANERGPGRAVADTVLPYYVAGVARRQYHHIHMHHDGNNLVYFVSPVNKPNAKLPKQSLTYKIRVTDINGQILDPFEMPITAVFLQSFTRDVHKVREVSKSSILEKIVDIYLSN